ncbi:MAG: DEAD/DEAH box helicase, partial [Promethearchaeota archaeon]
MLADEVGLGKTIEAGIFIKEMMARNMAERVLIIAPATLVKQWNFEMENKFNISFTIYDGKKVKTLLEKGSPKSSEKYINPFYHDNLIICSLQFARNERIRKLLAQISWDIVVFDEAHHLRRYLQNVSTEYYRETLNYKLAKELSESADSFLLLTATPLQLHSFELFSLVDLIQRGLFQNFSDFEHFRKNLPFINLLISNVNNLHKLNNFELHNTIKDFEYKNELLKKIEEDHTLAKVLIRNRKKNVFSKEFINKRIAQTIIVKPTRRELEAYNEIRLYLAKIYNTSMVKGNAGLGFIVTTLQKLLTSSKHALLKSLERRLEQINKLKDKQGKLDTITDEDPDFFEIELEAETIDSEALISEEENKSENNGILDLINQERILKEFKDKLERIPYD